MAPESMAELQILYHVFAVGAQLLRFGGADAAITAVSCLSKTMTSLQTIVKEVGHVQVNKGEFMGLSQDAADLIALLGYWATKGSERITEVYASLENLSRTLGDILKFIQQQITRGGLGIFVLSVEDVSKVKGYRQIMQSTSKNLEINFFQDAHFQHADTGGRIAKVETVKYEESGRGSGYNDQKNTPKILRTTLEDLSFWTGKTHGTSWNHCSALRRLLHY